MHVVVAAGSSFISQHRDFPSLVDCCAINIFKPWPEEALQSVAKVRLSDDQKSASDSLPTLFGRMHSLVGSSAEAEYTTTPADYLELLKLYGVILSRTKTTAEQNMQKYSSGLQKLYNTEEMVVELNKKLKLLVPTLERAKENVEVLMKKLTKDQAEAAEFKQFAQKEAATAQKKAKEVSKLKVDCQTELDEALPAFHAAVKALDALDKKSIQELKSFANPPRLVAFTMEAVCVLLGVKADWSEAKKLLTDIHFRRS